MSRRGTDVMAEDWDNLIILDACRYDMFEEMNTIPGRLETRVSKGSSTGNFLRKNFTDKTVLDTVYVTANPMYVAKKHGHKSAIGRDTFFKTVDVWEENWDENFYTVPPDEMVEPAKRAHDDHQNKRLIVHFLQPHRPWVGKTGKEITEQAGSSAIARMAGSGADERTGDRAWALLKQGKITKEQAMKAYYENLEIALPAVNELVEYFDGKTVVTSDHGNLAGEYAWPFPLKGHGHPNETFTKHLVKVPWLVIEGETRKKIIEGTSEVTSGGTVDINDRLADLGYVD
ncbi:sulfatase-like hydrolase/transferase [Haloarcula sp. GH36]|uniref:sulfatase-like hydrolase/transferase n=1 Tax=Haloarcula montana TaxID=3111776 RepID=UPI002D771AB5|nr:sulfatase-like hydrolase/transferase [Haloarcula sp. GH36]